MTELTIPNRKQRRMSLARIKRGQRAYKTAPEVPYYLVKALSTGKEDEVVRALDRAQAAGYELEYLAKKMGISDNEYREAMRDKCNP